MHFSYWGTDLMGKGSFSSPSSNSHEDRTLFVDQQFIGLKDKNGKEIFEGDRVKVKGTKRVGEYVTEIIWEGIGFKLKENKTYLVDYRILPRFVEIIGNIYENSELLTTPPPVR